MTKNLNREWNNSAHLAVVCKMYYVDMANRSECHASIRQRESERQCHACITNAMRLYLFPLLDKWHSCVQLQQVQAHRVRQRMYPRKWLANEKREREGDGRLRKNEKRISQMTYTCYPPLPPPPIPTLPLLSEHTHISMALVALIPT